LIDYLNEILNDDDLCMKVIKDELIEIKNKYGDADVPKLYMLRKK